MIESDCQSASYNRIWHRGLHVANFKTACARVDVLSTPDFGTTIFLDGEVQSSEADQELYHEALTRPLRVCAGAPIRRALIVGGGELCTLREVLKWPDLEHVDMIDYDGEFVSWCKKNLVAWHKNTFMDSRAHIRHESIYEALRNTDVEPYDAIVVDMTDISLNSANFAAEEEQFRTLMRGLLGWLAPHGSLVAYVGMWIPHKSAAMVQCMEAAVEEGAHHDPKYYIQPYRLHIPSFGTGEALFVLINEDGWNNTRLAWDVAPRAAHFHAAEAVRSVIFDVPAPDWWSAAL